ncbi:hypothetical protein ElyMa_003966900 [Elysia marginata]|uniref:Uncharacterized protein n=1 Tax=Elysia marginata TaxID=1093978 RepID=A0AAV4FVK5_9GAST|nr:hypothetical protein ElyMa_003966900 [Elysia marginata]
MDEQSERVIRERSRRAAVESLLDSEDVPKELKDLLPDYIRLMKDNKATAEFLKKLNLDSSVLAKDLSEAVTTKQEVARLAQAFSTLKYLKSNETTDAAVIDDDGDEEITLFDTSQLKLLAAAACEDGHFNAQQQQQQQQQQYNESDTTIVTKQPNRDEKKQCEPIVTPA